MDPSEPQPGTTPSHPEGTAPWTPKPGAPDPFAEHPAGEERTSAPDPHQADIGEPAPTPPPAAEHPSDEAAPTETPSATTAPDDPSLPGSKRAKRAAQLGAALAVITAAFLILGLWKPGFLNTTKLDVTIAQRSIEQLLADQANGYGLSAVSDVTCNNGQNPTVRAGATFTCTLRVGGTPRQLTVTFDNSSGDYTVSPPQ